MKPYRKPDNDEDLPCLDPDCGCAPACTCGHIHCMTENVFATRYEGLVRLTTHQMNRLTCIPPMPFIVRCDPCSERFGDGTVIYHINEQIPGDPVLIEATAMNLLEEQLH